ncbi:hypothetical protein JMK10_00100 [Rhodovulum sulfidophilum]|uniref:hypothetical protein n=1 Tax=Rhodovulum sulfidophilum TaxID=35806 RepID=UPI001922D428|nr:hypothetical protein [Rhodovulum sulfidophilum]MBL3576129.1 hypothetical protein [Rhodovulum sulfidophilum]MCE8432973.1 hypothetical protein [Rhodovulum sulfidophilum]MCF4115265.1 hypothetical protein [Rhodovulum sulfidophilum]
MTGYVWHVATAVQLTPQALEFSDQTVKRRTTRSGVARQAQERAAKVIDLMRTAVPLGVSICDKETDGRGSVKPG